MGKAIYYQVVEYNPGPNGDERRHIYTFDNETSANDMLEFILKNDAMPIDIRVETHETTT